MLLMFPEGLKLQTIISVINGLMSKTKNFRSTSVTYFIQKISANCQAFYIKMCAGGCFGQWHKIHNLFQKLLPRMCSLHLCREIYGHSLMMKEKETL